VTHEAFPASSPRAELASKCGGSLVSLKALYVLMSRAEDNELDRWRDRKLWSDLARRWHSEDPERRTETRANELFLAVCKGLGLRQHNGGARG
jgi:hypothetical protein